MFIRLYRRCRKSYFLELYLLYARMMKTLVYCAASVARYYCAYPGITCRLLPIPFEAVQRFLHVPKSAGAQSKTNADSIPLFFPQTLVCIRLNDQLLPLKLKARHTFQARPALSPLLKPISSQWSAERIRRCESGRPAFLAWD